MSRLAWKNWTFLAGLGWLIWGALFFDYPDWDIGISLTMALYTYACAQWCVSAFMERRYIDWPLAVVLTWWCVDGSYWIYWELVNPAVSIREGQWPMSLCLFFLCGLIWRLGPPWTWRIA